MAYNANHFLHQDLLQVIDMPILQKEKNVQLERLKSIHNTIDCSDFSCAVLTLSEKIAHVLRSNIESILSGIADKQMRVSKLAGIQLYVSLCFICVKFYCSQINQKIGCL